MLINNNKYLIIIVIIFNLATLSCGGGGGGGGGVFYNLLQPLENPIEELTLGISKDVSRFNNYNIYTLITSTPTTKPEDETYSSTWYDFELQTAVPTQYIASNNIHNKDKLLFKEGSFYRKVYSDAQIQVDNAMRYFEMKLLSEHSKQLNKISNKILASPSTITIGTVWNNINIYNGSDYVQINAQCIKISNYAYIFVDTRDTGSMSIYMEDYAVAFDTIYDIMHQKFGVENDTDSNNKVIIVFSHELTGGLLGYFYAGDKFSGYPSNEGDIIYITSESSFQGNIVKGTLAHELQHMIYFDEHYDRGVSITYTWLNEALSQAAEYYTGYVDNHHAWISNFLYYGYQYLSLTHWTSDNYGYGAIYIRYLIDRFGDGIIKNMCSTNNIGISAVESATGMDFNELFFDFATALVMSGTGDTDDEKYNFKTLNLQQLQPYGRGGLLYVNSDVYLAGDKINSIDDYYPLYPYEIYFCKWGGTFGTMLLNGDNSIIGRAFGLIR